MGMTWSEYKTYRQKKRKEEQSKKEEEQNKSINNKQTNIPSTYKRTIQPSATQTISNNNKLANNIMTNITGQKTNLQSVNLAKKEELKNQKLERIYEDGSTWGNIVKFFRNTGRAIDNLKEGAKNGIIGAGQSIIRDVSDIENFSSNASRKVTNKIFSSLGDKGKVTNMFVDASVKSMQNKRNEDRRQDLEDLQDIKNANTKNIQKNIFDANMNKDPIGTKLTELAPSMGQQLPGYAMNAVLPGSSLLYFKLSSEANYYDDAKERGMTEGQSKVYSKLMSWVEAGTEQLSVENIQKGGQTIKALSSGIKNAGLKNGLKAGIDVFKKTAKEETANSLKEGLKNYGIGIAEEAFQEAITEPIQEFTAMKVAGEDKADWNNMWQRMLQSGFDGALSSAIIAGANMGVSSCQGIVTKIENGQEISNQEYNKAVKDASKKVNIEKLATDGIKNEVNKLKSEMLQNQVTDNKVINQEQKTSQNGFSQTETLRQEARNKLESIKQNYDENSYNQMQEFIETAPSEKALNQVISDLNKEAETKQVAPLKQKQEVQLPMKQQETQNKSFEDVAFEAMNNYESNEVESPLKNRDMDSIGKQTKVNAYQYDNPQVKPYFQEMAQQMGEDLAYISSSDNRSTQKGGGTKLSATTKAMDILHNEQGYSYNQIAQGLQNIIDDKGSENNAISKKIELVIDEQLRNGYTNALGKFVEPNQEYINNITEQYSLAEQAPQNNFKYEKPVSIQQVTEEDYLTHAPNYYDGEQFDYNEHRNKTTKKVIREIIDIIDNSSNIKQDLIKAYQENEKSEGNHNELKTGLDEDNRFNYQYKESALSNFIDEINKGKNIKESEMYRLMKDYLKEQYSLSEETPQKQEVSLPLNENVLNNQNTSQEQYSLTETQPQNNFKYEQTDNEKVNKLYESTSKYFDDSQKTHNMLKPMEKIIRDKGYNITFDDTLDDNVNGRIRTNQETGETEITINPNSNRKGEFIIGHELTHAIETQEMVDLVKKRMEKDGELRNAVEDLKKLYGTDDINGEVLADISGQLFGNQEFINNLSVEKPSIFKRIYDTIVSLANKITGNSNEALFLKDLKNKWEKAYRENTNNIKEAQYSETNIIKDNKGRQLSNQQQEYFKDSKVRDKNGNLLTVYHGTEANAGIPKEYWFSIFDEEKQGNHGSWFGNGFYFTSDLEHAKDYAHSKGNVYETYLNITNPYIPYKNGNSMLSFQEDFKNNFDEAKNIEGNLNGKQIQEILKNNGYDGIIIGDNIIAFNSNQIKNIDNKTPTTNPDIRYSLSEDGAMKDNKTGKKVTLQAESMNDGKNLLAIHNLTEDKLKGVLELGGFPVPSIAVTNQPHTNFGDISVIFNKNTIDPSLDKANKVYSRDAYTARTPNVVNKINEKGLKEVSRNTGIEEWNLRENYKEISIEDAVEKLRRNENIIDKYLKEKGIEIEPVYRDFKGFTHLKQDSLQDFINQHKELVDLSYTDKYSTDTYKKYYNDVHNLFVEDIMKEAKISREKAESFYKDYPGFNHWDYFIRDLNAVQELKGKQQLDEYATKEAKEKAVDVESKEYKDYVKKLISPMYGEKYIRNNKDYYTASGTPRSFNQRYEEYTLDNIVKIMNENKGTGQESTWGVGINEIAGDASKRFKNIKDIKNNENLLMTQNEDEHKQILDKYNTEFRDIENSILDKYSESSIDGYVWREKSIEDAMKNIARKMASNKKITEQNVISQFDTNGIKINENQAQRVISLIKNLSNLPTNYFEAKPQRAVGFDEIDAIVIPKDVSKEVKQQLKDRGIKTIEYDRNNENERADILKSLNEYKFSKTSKSWQDYLEKNYKSEGTTTDLRDIRLPMKQKQEVKVPIKQKVLKGNDGKTLKVYHGSPNANITEFDSNKAGSNTQSDFEGIYFTDNPSIAEDFSYEQLSGNSNLSYKRGNKGKVYENNLKYNNALNLNNLTEADIQNLEKYIDNDKLDGISKEQAVELMKKMAQNNNAQGVKFYLDFNALKNDYDLIIADMGGKYKGSNEYIVFNNNQIISNDNTATNKQEVKLPMKQENTQQTQEQNNNTKGENINWTEIERPEENRKFRKHYKSIIESDNTTAEAKSIAKDLMGTDTYTPETNKGQLAQADQRIMTSSPEVELQSLLSRAMNGEKISSVDIAVGERLIQYFSKTGNKQQLQDAIQATAMAGTSAGQTVQALSMLNHQTPQGQATWIQRSVDKMNKELAKKKGGTITTDADGNLQVINKQGVDITDKVDLFNLTPEMIDKIMNSENQEQMYKNIDEVYEELGQQVPLGTLEKIDSWRYFSMLANARTHIRNMVGNLAMGKTQRIKDKLAGGIEDVVSKFNPEMERTKTLAFADKKTKDFAKQDFKNMEVQSRLELNENKYNPQSRLQNARRTFKSNAMENTLGRLFDLNDKLLEAEDGIGLKAGYQKALADYITANKIDVDNITDAQLGKARNYAIQQAKEATFHQANAIASAVTQFQNKNNVTKFFTDALLPFKKTPMNVAKAGMEYSPLQIAKSATVDLVNLRKGKISINQYIDNLSKGMTGTGIALAGYALAKAGILKASGGDDKDKEKYDEEQGKQSYSIQIAGKTYSLDWLAPTGIPLFIGAETHKLFNQEENEKGTEKRSEEDRLNQAIKGASNLLNAGATAINPMSEMSMISGLTSALSSYNTSDNLGSLGNMMTNMGKSYVNQFFPTLMGQVAKTGDEYERTTKSTAKGTIVKAFDQTKNQIMNKIPGLRQKLPIKTDIWGKDVKQEANLPLRAFNNFINPATVKEVSTDKVDMELNKLYEENHSSSLLPDILTKTVQLNKQTYRLSNKEYAEFTKNYGQTSHKLIENFIKTSDYNKLTQEQKETAISNIYSYAKEQNKLDYAKKVNEEVKPSTLYTTMKEIEKNGGKQSEYLSYLAKTKGISKENEKNKVLADSNYSNKTKEIIYTNGTGKDDNLYNNLLSKSHINMTEYLDYKDKVSNKVFSADKDKNGKTVTGSAKAKVINYLNNNITGVGNRLLIAGKSYALQNSEKQKLAEYINQIANTREERIEIYKQLDKNFYVRNEKVYMRVSK